MSIGSCEPGKHKLVTINDHRRECSVCGAVLIVEYHAPHGETGTAASSDTDS